MYIDMYKHNQKQRKRCSLLCKFYKPSIISNYISKKKEQHSGVKWLIHGTKHHKDNQLQGLELPMEYPSR